MLRVSVAVVLILAVVASIALNVARSPMVIAGEMSTVFYPASVTSGGTSVSSISYSSDGTLLAAAVDDGSVRVFRVLGLRPIGGLPTGTRALLSPIAFLPGGHDFAAATSDGAVRVWHADTGQEVGSPMIGHTDLVRGLAVSPDGRLLASDSEDGTIRLWNLADRTSRLVLRSGGTVFDKLAFSLDGRRLCAVGGVLAPRSFNEVTRFWDTTTGRQLGNAPSDGALTYALAYTVDGRTVLVDSVRGVSYLNVGTRVGERLPLDGIYKAAFSADGRELVTIGGTPVEVRFWSIAERRQIGTTITSRGQVTDVVFSPDGRTVATSTATGGIRLFRTP